MLSCDSRFRFSAASAPLALALLAGSALSTSALALDAPAVSEVLGAVSGASAGQDDYIRTAQLEWLFGSPKPQRPVASPPRTSPAFPNDNRRYIYKPRQDMFGNTTYERVLAPNQPRMREDGTFVVKVDPATDRIRQKAADKLRSAPPVPPTNGPLLITVSLSKQQLTLYDQGVPIATSPVSSGSRGHETPTGVYSVLQKQYFHRSNMYSSAPMPYMQRITWSGVALHGGELPGYAASHGCVRLPEAFAIRLWGTTQPGMRVIITNGEVKPVSIEHPVLFTPKLAAAMPPAPVIAPPAPPEVTPPQANPPQMAPSVPLPPVRNAPSSAPEVSNAPPAEAIVGVEATKAEFIGAASESLMETAARTVPAIAEVSIVRAGQGNVVMSAPVVEVAPPLSNSYDGVRTQRITILRGGQPEEYQIVDMPPSATDSARQVPVTKPITQQPVAELQDDDDDAQVLALPVIEDMPPILLAYNGNDFMQFAARRTQRRAEAEPVIEAPKFDAVLPRPGPVAIYISRREQRIYVRKSFEAVFDAPITISGSDRPMGTHVFSANALTEDRSAFRWTVVSLADQKFGNRSSSSADEGRAARAVLDRLQIPAETSSRISEIIGVGATIIVTDQGPGSARSLRTDSDFSVVTK